jgi:hypothetical protein
MFSPEMDVRQVGADRWMLLQPLTWNGPDWTITAPSGFVTNFASVPRPFWVLWPQSGAWNPATVIHDYECRVRFRPAAEVHARFGETLKALGVSWVTRTILRLGVSQFGPTWNTMRVSGMDYDVGPGALLGVPEGYRCARR